MARIPQNIAGGRLDTGPMVDYSGIGRSPVGAALQGLGADLQGASDTMVMAQQRYQAQQEEAENFEATQQFQRFKIAAQGEVTEIAQKVPVNGLGFHDQSVSAFDKRRQEFIATVPERLRPKFDQLLQTERDMFSQRQAGAELEQRQKWYRDGLSDAVSRGQEQVYNDPTAWEAAKQEALRSVDASGLPEIEKADWRKKVEQGLATSLATRELAANPSGLVGSLGVAVQREASGAVVLPSDPKLPAGMRNNNPGNIKFIGQGKDQGVLGPSKNTDQGDPQAVFATPEAGMAAAYKLALKKYGDGRKTANQIIAGERGWTPGNTKAAENVARGMGLGPDDDLNLSDPQRAQSFLRALVRQEHGPASDAYTDELIAGAISWKASAAGAKADVVFGQSNQIAAGQGYLQVAQAFIGANENQDADVLASFIKKSTGTTLDPRQTAWCAAYVNAVLGSQGVQGTGSLAARSFLDFGEATDKPSMGDIVVLSRGAPGSGKGHVGFFAGYDANGNVKILGGNQSQAVNVSSYPPDQVLGFRRPPSVGSTEEANARLAKLPGGGPSGGMVVTELDPRFASLPFAERLKLSSQAQQQTLAQQQAAVTQQKAEHAQLDKSINLGIVTGDITSEEEILNAGLDDGNTAARLTQFRAKQKEAGTIRADIDAFTAGNLALDPFDPDGKKRADALFIEMSKVVEPGQVGDIASGIIEQTGVVPQPVMNAVRRGLSSQNPADVAEAAQTAQRIATVDPAALARRDGGAAVQQAADDFSYFVNKLNLDPNEAAQRLIEQNDPEKKRQRTALEPAAKVFRKEIEEGDGLSDVFDYDAVGFNPSQQAGITAEYLAIAESEFYRANGDPDLAKNRAAEQMKRLYGVTELTGKSVLMKHPPENYWPKTKAASEGAIFGIGADPLGYARAQLRADVAAASGASPVPSGNFPGLAEKGNIDLAARPQVKNSDGTISTVKSMSFQDDNGLEVLVPTISDDGRNLTDEEAINLYYQSGKHLGKFKTADEATKYAGALHEAQESFYTGSGGYDPSSIELVTTPQTDAEVKAGKMPGYAVMWRDKNGNYQTIPGQLWRPDFTAVNTQIQGEQQQQQSVIDAGVDDAQQLNSDIIEGRDRDQSLDTFLDGPPVPPAPQPQGTIMLPQVKVQADADVQSRLDDRRQELLDSPVNPMGDNF